MTFKPDRSKNRNPDPKFDQLGSNQIVIWNFLRKGGKHPTMSIVKKVLKDEYGSSSANSRARAALLGLEERGLITSKFQEREAKPGNRCGKNRLRGRRQIRVWWAVYDGPSLVIGGKND